MFTIYNLKGGVGKTAIAMNLALTLRYGVITNDPYSPIEELIANTLKLNPGDVFPDVPSNAAIIFDLGGHVDKHAAHALKGSTVILIPVVNDYPTLKTTVRFAREIIEINPNIAFIANRTKKGDFEFIQKALNLSYDCPVFELKESMALPNLFHEKKSIQEQVAEGGLKRHSYEPVKEQFDTILTFLKKHHEYAT